MTKRVGSLILAFLTFVTFSTVLAETTEKSENNTGGVVDLEGPFKVFPAGKKGNTLYKKNKKIISKDDLILMNVIEELGGFVYYGINESNQPILGYVGDPKTTFTSQDGGFYQLITENGRKRIYRLNEKKEIQNLLPRSNTASGLVYNNIDKAAFIHITKGETIETEDGKLRYQYTFKIHIVKIKEDQIVHLPNLINDFKSSIKLEWLDVNTLQYSLSNGQKKSLIIE